MVGRRPIALRVWRLLCGSRTRHEVHAITSRIVTTVLLAQSQSWLVRASRDLTTLGSNRAMIQQSAAALRSAGWPRYFRSPLTKLSAMPGEIGALLSGSSLRGDSRSECAFARRSRTSAMRTAIGSEQMKAVLVKAFGTPEVLVERRIPVRNLGRVRCSCTCITRE
jgi:hypothetical protein